MPNLAKLLKDEISRISRREIKKELDPIKALLTAQRKTISELKKKAAGLDVANRKLQRAVPAAPARGAAAEEEGGSRQWFTGKGVRSMRKKLKLSQADFAKLAGVSDQSVYNWERQNGKLLLRQATAAKLAEIRGLGIRGAKSKLEG